MVIHHQFTKLIFALRRGLIKINPLYDPDLFLNNRLLGFRPWRSGELLPRKVNLSSNFGYYINNNKYIRFIGIIATLSIVLLITFFIFPIVKSDDTAEATVVPATTTLTITSSSTTASVDVTPISSNGTFAASEPANDIAFTVTTNNVTGYNLTIAGSDDTRKLVNGDAGGASSNATLDSITTATSTADFTSGSASTYSNKWGYKPSMYNSASNTNYLQAPTTTAETLNKTTKANGTTTTCNNPSNPACSTHAYTIGLGARVDYTKPTGTYTNTFIITTIANNVAYQINYKDTTGDTISSMPASDGSSIATASAFTLSSTKPTRTGYEFKGWCYGTVNHTNNPSTCAGTTYQPGANFTFTSISSTNINTANLYAMWENTTPSMQNLDPTLCTTTPMTVVDKRDNKEYTIAKLADGNCWLLENLRLDISDPTVQANLTSATTNATDSTLGYLKNGGGSSPYPANGVIAKTASGGSWTDSYDNPYIATEYKNTIQPASGAAVAGRIGIYYNFCAASAGSYCYAGNASSGDASQDICPAGWRMPTGGASGEYQALYIAYNSDIANFGAAISVPLSGLFISGSAVSQGQSGYFWSSTRYNGIYMSHLSLISSFISPQNYNVRYYGFSVRCVAK